MQKENEEIVVRKTKEAGKTVGVCLGYVFLLFALGNALKLGSDDPGFYFFWFLVWGLLGVGTLYFANRKE